MAENSERYTSREDVENLLQMTRDSLVKKPKSSQPGVKKKRRVGKIIRNVLFGLVLAALLFMLAKVWIARINGEVASLFGYQMYVVETGSMIPTIPIGSNILVRELGPDDTLKVGDIVTYSKNTSAITHRITELVTGEDGILRYQTQGDNPDNSPDPWLVSREDIRGIVIQSFIWPWARQ